MQCMPSNKSRPGFTLVEMLVISPIVLLTIASFIGVLIYLTGETMIARTSNTLAYKVQDSLTTIEQDVALSGAFLATNSVAIASPQGYNNATQSFQNASTTTGSMLIINAIATQSQHYTPQHRLIPLRDMPYPCSNPAVNGNQVMTYNIVYFVKNNSLWRRTLMPSNYETIGCNTPWQRPSCEPGQTGGMCRIEDMKLLDGVTSADFTVQYFSSAQSTSPMTDATDTGAAASSRQDILSNANTALITLKATQSVAGKEADYTGTLRVTRIGLLSEQVTPVP